MQFCDIGNNTTIYYLNCNKEANNTTFVILYLIAFIIILFISIRLFDILFLTLKIQRRRIYQDTHIAISTNTFFEKVKNIEEKR